MQHKTDSPEQTKKIAAKVVSHLSGGSVLALVGELGAGKTTFVQGIAEALGIQATITSPTFIIVREYPVAAPLHNNFETLYHLDLYRIDSVEEVLAIGLDEVLHDPTGIIVIEWADKFPDLLPPHTVWIHFHHATETQRTIIITKGPS